MTSGTRRPLPTALFLALIPIGWSGVTVVVTGMEGLFGIFPSRRTGFTLDGRIASLVRG